MVSSLAIDRLDDRGSEPVSKKRESLEASIGRLVTIRIAHNWMFSKRSLTDELHPSKSTEANFRTCLIIEVYNQKSILFPLRRQWGYTCIVLTVCVRLTVGCCNHY